MDGLSTPKETTMNKDELIAHAKELIQKINISNEKYIETMNFMMKFAKEHSGDFVPTMLVVSQDEEKIMIAIPQQTSAENKYEAMKAVGEKLHSEGITPTLLVFSSEVWMSQYDKNNVPENIQQPSQDPNRVEKLMVSGLALDGRAALALADISRDWQNKLVIGEFGEIIQGGEVNLLAAVYIAYFDKVAKHMCTTVTKHIQDSVSRN